MTTTLHACAEPLQPDVCVDTTPFTDVDETTHDDDALLEAVTVDPSEVTVVATVVSVDTVVSAGAPEADPSAIEMPAAAIAAKARPAAIHFIPAPRGGRKTPQLPEKYPHCARVTQVNSL